MRIKEFYKLMRIACLVYQLSSHFEKASEIWTKKTKNVYCTKIATFRNNMGSEQLKQRLISRWKYRVSKIQQQFRF